MESNGEHNQDKIDMNEKKVQENKQIIQKPFCKIENEQDQDKKVSIPKTNKQE